MADDDQSLGHIELSMDDVIKVFFRKMSNFTNCKIAATSISYRNVISRTSQLADQVAENRLSFQLNAS